MDEYQKPLRPAGSSEVTFWSVMQLLLHKFYLLLLAGIALALVVFLILNFLVTPTYESRVSFYVYNSADGTAGSGTINNNDLQAAESLATTYSKILESNSVLDAVLQDLGSDSGITRKELSEMVDVAVVTDTQLLEVVITSTDADFACRIADSFAKVAPIEIVRITKAGGVEVVDRPEVATEKSSPRTVFDTAVGFVAGVILISVILILKMQSDTTIYLPEDVEKLAGVTVLGQIPEIEISEDQHVAWSVIKGGVVRLEEKKHKTDSDD
ncbi:MAG: YveK family protein [Eubacteriales bacterium]